MILLKCHCDEVSLHSTAGPYTHEGGIHIDLLAMAAAIISHSAFILLPGEAS